MHDAWLSDFVKCIEESTLKRSRMEEAWAMKATHLPNRLYKYRVDCANSRRNLQSDTVWLSSPDKYNDPYDCVFKVMEHSVVAAMNSALVDKFILSYRPQGISPSMIDAAKKSSEPLKVIAEHISALGAKGDPQRMADFVSRAGPDLVRGALSTVRQWRETTKACPFSEVMDSIIMWSHYADNHRGFCLEYDFESLGENHPLCKKLYPVVYSERIYDLTPWAETLVAGRRDNFNPEAPVLAVIHKFVGWKYEKEWRLLEVTKEIKDDHSCQVPPPTKIFLGSMMDPCQHRELLAICEQKGTDVYQMRLVDDRFALLPERFKG